MVTPNDWWRGNNVDYEGTSNDTKPTENIRTNALFLELDTGDFYFYDGSSWQLLAGEGGGGGGGSPEGTSIKSTGEPAGKVLTSDGSDGASWQDLNATNLKSTGATTGQVLVADGSGGVSWATIPAANTQDF